MSVWGGFATVRFDAMGEAVDSKISLIASATSFVFPLACKTKAAEPATNGADKKVQKSVGGLRESGAGHSTGHTGPRGEAKRIERESTQDAPARGGNRWLEVQFVGRSQARE